MSHLPAVWVCPICGTSAALLEPCAVCAPAEGSPTGALDQAELALGRGRAALAVRLLEGASPEETGRDPERATTTLARAYLRHGRLQDAAAALLRLGPGRPGSAALALELGEALVGAGDPQGAFAALALAGPSRSARLLQAEAQLLAPGGDARVVAEGLESEAKSEPGLHDHAGRALATVASTEVDPERQRALFRRAANQFERGWALGPATVDAAVRLADARLSAEAGAPVLALLEGVEAEGQRSAGWHRAYLRALLAAPGEGEPGRSRRAADAALALFPEDAELARLGQVVSREAWERKRRALLGGGASAPEQGDEGDGPPIENAPDFLSDLRARMRKGALPPTREVPDRQREIVEVLCRYERANAIVTGPPGCGKSALLRAVAHQIHARRGVPAMLKSYGLYELDPIAIVGGTDNVGVLESRLTALARFCEINKLILFIDNFHLVLGAGSYNGRPAGLSELMQPLMSGANVKIVAATSDESFDALTKSVGLERRMTRIRVPAMSVAETTRLLEWRKPQLEMHYEQILPDAVLALTARMAEHHNKSRALPDSAIDLLEQACAKALIDGETELRPGHLLRALAQLLRVPLEQVQLDRMSRLLGLEDLLAQRVIGQTSAIRAVSDVIRMSKAELDLHPDRPDGVFLFVGPSGVGKTELARGLAELLNADETGFVRLDMSEFTEPHNVSRLFGTTPGYVGYEQEGQLTGALRLNPGAVILLDEVEKAHPKVYDVFLQVFDAGRMTDGRGKVVDCSHATFIMTSNLGTAELGEAKVGFLREPESRAGLERTVRTALEKHFRTEFLNRLDAVVVFHALSEQTLNHIVEQKLDLVRTRFAAKGIDVSLDPALIPLIAARTDRMRNGARGLIRAIEQMIVIPLTREVLTHQPPRAFRVTADGQQARIET